MSAILISGRVGVARGGEFGEITQRYCTRRQMSDPNLFAKRSPSSLSNDHVIICHQPIIVHMAAANITPWVWIMAALAMISYTVSSRQRQQKNDNS